MGEMGNSSHCLSANVQIRLHDYAIQYDPKINDVIKYISVLGKSVIPMCVT